MSTRYDHRPDCTCAQCGMMGFRAHLGAIPRVSTGSRIIFGMGQDDGSDDGSGDVTDYSADDTSVDDTVSEPAAAPADDTSTDDTSTDDTSTDDTNTDDTSEDDTSTDDSSGFTLPSLSQLFSTGKQAVQTYSTVSKALKSGGSAPGPAPTGVRAVTAPSGAVAQRAVSGSTAGKTNLALIAGGALLGAFLLMRKK